MSTDDAQRWDKRYQSDERYSTYHEPRSFLVKNIKHLPPSGFALDVATGLGGIAGYLIELGYQVVGVDISSVAIQRAKKRWPGLRAMIADLNHFYLPENRFDLILNFKINEFLSASFMSQVIYDYDIKFDDGIGGQESRVQLKELLGLGLTYNFKNF